MKKYKLLFGTLLCCQAVLAAASPAPHFVDGQLFISAGANFERLSNGTQAIALNSLATNTYIAAPSTEVNFASGLEVGAQFHYWSHFVVTLGPAFYFNELGNVHGLMQPLSSPFLSPLNYQYSVESSSLLAESRVICTTYAWQPFVIGGVGYAWNLFRNYSESLTNPTGIIQPTTTPFQDNAQGDFAYEVGVGIQRAFYDANHQERFTLGLSYRYFNLGLGKFAPSTVQITQNTLSINPVETQAVLVSWGTSFN